MAMTMTINQERLRELFDYNEDGSFKRKVRTGQSTHVGQTVHGCLHYSGYRLTKADNIKYMHHRLVWIWHNGEIPEGMEVDHINKIRDDNRIENLQLLNHKDHKLKDQAGRKQSNNKSGIANIYWHKRDQAWRVQFQIDGKQKHFGTFKSKREAFERRNEVAEELGLSLADWHS